MKAKAKIVWFCYFFVCTSDFFNLCTSGQRVFILPVKVYSKLAGCDIESSLICRIFGLPLELYLNNFGQNFFFLLR